jgi:hypothetical protein
MTGRAGVGSPGRDGASVDGAVLRARCYLGERDDGAKELLIEYKARKKAMTAKSTSKHKG